MGCSWVRLPVVRAAAPLAAALLLPLLLAPGAGAGTPAAAGPSGPGSAPSGAAPAAPVVLVLVRSWSWEQARPVARASQRPVTVGLVSTLPADASLASRVLSLAAGRRVDARALAAGASPEAVARLREDNPDAELGGLPAPSVHADPGLEGVGVVGLAGPAGSGPARAEPLGDGPPARAGLVVVAVDGAGRLAAVLPRLPGQARVLVVGLEPSPGRARTAPYLELGRARGVATSTGTRRDGLVALEDVRASLLAVSGPGAGRDPVRVVAEADPVGALDRLDRRVAALVAARTWAVPLLVLVAAAAVAGMLVAGRSRPAAWRPVRALLALTLALPAGYLVASWVAPGSAVAWLALGVAVAAALAAVAGRVARDAAPAALGAVLLLLLVGADLATGGEALSRPLLGGSAFDGERFYGLGNGYFACALAAVVLVIAFWRVPRAWAAALFALLAVVDGLPWLGADVGGALSAMLTAAAAWELLGERRPGASSGARALARGRRSRPRVARPVALVALVAVALAAGILLAFGNELLTSSDATHAGRFVDQALRDGPAAAARVFAHKLEVNARLLLATPFGWVGPAVTAAGLAIALRGWPGLGPVPARVRRAVLVGVTGSAALILLNDTGVTAAAASGLFLVAALAWAVLPAPHAAASPPPGPGGRRPPDPRLPGPHAPPGGGRQRTGAGASHPGGRRRG
jgi:hypothetical protein